MEDDLAHSGGGAVVPRGASDGDAAAILIALDSRNAADDINNTSERAPAIDSAALNTATASRDNGNEQADGDTIATRTRTKLSLVNVPIDTLESCLPDIVEPILGDDEGDHEYQRFLSSLLPNEQENLSFLDEEDEAYEPPDDDDDDDEEEEEDDGDGDAAATSAKQRVTARISKKELTELLWDSTRLGLPLPSAAAGLSVSGNAAAGSGTQLFTRGSSSESTAASSNRMGSSSSDSLQHALPFASMLAVPPPPPLVLAKPAPAWFRRPSDGAPPTSVQELHGSISQEQCIQLASQMHKHVQLLLQNYHLFASPSVAESGAAAATGAAVTGTDDPVAARAKSQRLAALRECRQMIEELQTRGERAQQCKGALLAKLSQQQHSDASNGSGASRRVTRSLTAAHAAVAHPSMFELVGPQALDELTRAFSAQCGLAERNRAIQEQMHEVDSHLLGTKKKNPKKPFTPYEDKLLAHGAKRFALHADSWTQIERNFLPGKSPAVIQRRYRYLTSNKTGMSAVKAYHAQFPRRRDASWILEEDLRIARGMVEYHNDNKRFARVGVNYLPHRSRLELRKRWERIRTKFFSVVAAQNPEIDDTSIDFAVLVKDLLEDKLREQVKQQSLELMEHGSGGGGGGVESDPDVKPDGFEASSMAAGAGGDRANRTRRSRLLPMKASACTTKHLHPALFFTSWALINPGALLNKTCEHNWPSFIDEMAAQQQQQSDELPQDQQQQQQQSDELDASLAAPTIADPKAVDVTPSSRFVDESLATESTSELSAGDAPPSSNDDAALFAAHLRDPMSVASADVSADVAAWMAAVAKPDTPASGRSESEPSTANTSAVLEDEEDDDSDYEHDELVSSDGDHGSDSDDFEQLELSDDDDDDEDEEDDSDDFDYEELDISDNDDNGVDDSSNGEQPDGLVHSTRASVERSTSAAAAAEPLQLASNGTSVQQVALLSPRTPIRHTLRLQNLQRPNDEHTKRALAALERRIVGRSVTNSPAKPPAARPSDKKRIVARVALASQNSTSGSVGTPMLLPAPVSAPAGADAFCIDDTFASAFDATNALDFDLETDEVLGPSSGDESFEREELSSGDESGSELGGGDNDRALDQEPNAWRPNKKAKLLPHAGACSACDSTPCHCSSRRMGQLLRRMRRASSSTN